MSMVFKTRTAPVPTVVTQRWYPNTYKRFVDGIEFPVITQVPESGDVPEHGTYEGPAGTVIVNKGDYITVGVNGVAAGDYASYGLLDFNSQFEAI